MIQITVQKNLIALEDLLLGFGTATQTRGPTGSSPVTINKINGQNIPYDLTHSLKQKFDALQAAIDTAAVVVDQDGNLLTGLIDTSSSDLSSTHSGRIWRKSISSTEVRIYYGTQLMFKYNPTDGDLIIASTNDYIAADAVVTTAYQTADAAIIAAYIAADLVVHNAYIAADVVVHNAYIAADAVVTTAYLAADAVLDAKINNRANVVQQTDIAASSNVTKTITMTDGVWVKITVTSDFTLAFVFPTVEVRSMILQIVNGGAYAITWPAGTKYPGGSIALTAAGTDHVAVYRDAANQLYVSIVAADVK